MKSPYPITLGALALIAAVLSPGAAEAKDVVVLKDGRRIEGTLEDHGKWVEVFRTYGSIKIQKEDIQRIQVDDGAEAREDSLQRAADRGSVDEKLALALHYEREGRGDLARTVYKEIISIDSDHEVARRSLGYQKVDGLWLTEEEAAVKKGLVPYKGRWVEPAERDALIRAEIAQAELEQAKVDERRERARARREERRERERARREFLAWRPKTAYAGRYDDYRRGGYGYGSSYGYGYYGYGRRSALYDLGLYTALYGPRLIVNGQPVCRPNVFTGYGTRFGGGVSVTGSFTGSNYGVKFRVGR